MMFSELNSESWKGALFLGGDIDCCKYMLVCSANIKIFKATTGTSHLAEMRSDQTVPRSELFINSAVCKLSKRSEGITYM